MRSLFISDLHLTPERPDITRAFLAFLEKQSLEKQEQDAPLALYILGDFFEYWIGDDVMDEFQQMIAHQLRQLANNGVKLYFMHGNRDFLVGSTFCQLAGCTLLPDPSVITLTDSNGHITPVVLMHGDSLCTEDKGYQRFRRIVRTPWVQKLFLALPSHYRRGIARKLRHKSRSAYQTKPLHFVDVAPAAVEQALDNHQVDILIHGHTHRAAIHPLPPHPSHQRIVLGDWNGQGGYFLSHSDLGLELLDWRPTTDPVANTGSW